MDLARMTPGTIFGRDDNGDVLAEMFVYVRVVLVGPVTFKTPDVGSVVSAGAPLLINAWVGSLMALDAFRTGL